MSERDWLVYFLAKRNMGAVICEGPEIEAACLEFDRLNSDYAALLARHNALREAVEWERECQSFTYRNPLSIDAMKELLLTRYAARAEVDRLLQEQP